MGVVLHKMLEKFDITSLPALPHLLLRLLVVCDQEEAQLEDMLALLRQDQALTAQVLASATLRPAKSSVHGSALQIAFATLGVEDIRELALNAALNYIAHTTPGVGLNEIKQRWHHALLSAHLARALASKVAYADGDEAYLAGLLHDIGRAILWAHAPTPYLNAMAGAHDEAALLARESRELKINHAQAGASVAQSWGLRSFLADAIRYHHELPQRLLNAHVLVRIVSVAHYLAEVEADAALDTSVLAVLNLSADDARALQQLAQTRLGEAETAFAVAPHTEPAPAQPDAEPEGERRRFRADAARTQVSPLALAEQALPQQLAERVRDMVAIQSAKNSLFSAPDLAAWQQALRHNLQSLFGLKEVVLFLPSSREGVLQGVNGAANGLAEQIQIAADDPHSLLARALRQGHPLHSFQTPEVQLTVLDEQVMSLAGGAGMLCLPLLSTGKAAGLAVCAISAEDAERLTVRLPVLSRLGHQAGSALGSKLSPKAPASPPRAEQARKILHEVNNPLSIVKNYLRIVAMKLPQDDAAHADLKIISDEIDRVGSMLKGLLGGQGFAPNFVANIDLNRTVMDMLSLLKPTLIEPARVQVQTLLAADLPALQTDAGQLKQILQNLIKNAVEAMPDGGKLRIVSLRTQIRSDVGVELRIEDSGQGIPDAIRARLFQPVATRKGGDHAGLGLAIVNGLVRGLGGSIECEAMPVGTAFIIRLPAPVKRS
jgi:putative nucleotidyltransferase with HDIG domain